jgi:ABC-type transport system substrate-binding protein
MKRFIPLILLLIVFILLFSFLFLFKQEGKLERGNVTELNITVNIIPMSWADAVSLFKDPKKSPNLFPLYSSSAYPDPNNYLWSAYHSSTAGEWTNPGHYKNNEVDKILEEALGTLDEEKRKELYAQAQRIIVEDAPNIFGVSPPDFHVWSKSIRVLIIALFRALMKNFTGYG